MNALAHYYAPQEAPSFGGHPGPYQPQPHFGGSPGPLQIVGNGYPVYGAAGPLSIVGYDGYGQAIMGQGGPMMGAAPTAEQMAMVRQAGGVVIEGKRYTELREQPLPITATSVNTTLSATISLRPQRLFRVEELRLSSTHSAPFFTVDGVFVGQENQFVAQGTIPGDLFSEVSRGNRLKGDTANLGNTLDIVVTNIDVLAAARVLRGAFFGTVLLPA